MNITTQGIGIRIGERTEEKITGKFEKFDRYFGDKAQIAIKIRPEKNVLKVETTMKVNNQLFRAEAKNEDMVTAVDATVDRLESQIRKQKSKFERKIQNYAYMKEYLKDMAIQDAEEPEEETGILKRKNFDLTPMTEDEAILQMEMLDHTFYMFLNAEDGIVSVVYKRADGNYGLLIPNY